MWVAACSSCQGSSRRKDVHDCQKGQRGWVFASLLYAAKTQKAVRAHRRYPHLPGLAGRTRLKQPSVLTCATLSPPMMAVTPAVGSTKPTRIPGLIRPCTKEL